MKSGRPNQIMEIISDPVKVVTWLLDPAHL